MQPSSLVTRVYMVRYFEGTDFLYAKLGNNPSYIWRSILKARNVIIAGTRWRLGSRERIPNMGQPWLLQEDNPYITSSGMVLENNTVASLMFTDKKEWDIDVIKDLFNDRDQSCILSIPVAADNDDDTLF